MKRADRRKLKQAQTVTENPHSNPNKDSTDDHKRSVTGSLHIRGEIIAIPSPEETLARKTQNDNQETNDTRKRRIEYVMLGVVTLYTIFAGWQAFSSSGQLEEARKITRATNENFQVDQRAWVGIFAFDATIVKGQPAQINVHLRNVGKTPALHVRSIGIGNPVLIGSPKPLFDDPKYPPVDWGLLLPNADTGMAVSFAINPNQPLTTGAIQEIQSGNRKIYIYGHIIYDDIFGNSHLTNYCYILRPNPIGYGFISCHEHNDAN
jgi:hypothetical protein